MTHSIEYSMESITLDKEANIAQNLPSLNAPIQSANVLDIPLSTNTPEALADEANYLRHGMECTHQAYKLDIGWESTFHAGHPLGANEMSLSKTGKDGDESPMDQSAVDDVKDSEHQDNNIEYNTKMGCDYSIELCMSPSLESAQDALADLKLLLPPLQASGTGHNGQTYP